MSIANPSNGSFGSLLSEVTEFRGGHVAELGQWLVVFRHNVPQHLYPTGTKVRRGWNAPLLGAGIATLDTTPQDMSIQVRDCPTSDGYRVADMTVRLQVRLRPEVIGADEEILTRIRLHGHQFFDSIASDIQQRVSSIIRIRILRTSATAILNRGPMAVIFPDEPQDLLGMPHVEITSISQIDWTETELHREVRQVIERDHAERSKEDYLREDRERAARVRAHQQLLDADHRLRQQEIDTELRAKELDSLMQRAHTLGIDPVAVAEPALWETISRQHHEVVLKLLESPHLHPIMRSNPELMRAVLRRVSGDTSPLPMGRQADMVLDGIDPKRPQHLAGAKVISTSASLDYIHRAGLFVDPLLAAAWQNTHGTPELSGAAYSVPHGQSSCMVLVLASPAPVVPAEFATLVRRSLHEAGIQVEKVGVFDFEGRSLDDVITTAVQRIESEVKIDLNLRQTSDRREVFVRLSGPAPAVQNVYGRMTDPTNPILPTLEGLIDNRAVIRFAVPGA